MNYIDLFLGIGGFALGAYWAGVRFEKHYFSEVDDYCCKLYSHRFPEAIPLGDITKIEVALLPKEDWMVTGGFPCQDISIAGKGEGISGKRSGLWFAMFDVIGILRPRFAIIENVGAITIRGLDTVLGCLAEIGYSAEWQDIRASDMGAPHRRERIWIVAYPSCNSDRGIIRNNNGKEKKNRDRIYEPVSSSKTQDVADTEFKQKRASYPQEVRRIDGYSPQVGAEGGDDIRNSNATLQERSQPGGWLPEPNMGRLAHGVSRRVERLKGLGNSIVPQIAELLFRQIKELIDN